MEKKYKKRDRFELFALASKAASPLLGWAFYVLAFVAVLLGMVALIVLFVNVPTEDMMLPPFMHTVRGEDGIIEGYNIMVGNGIRMYADYADVELGDIKTVIWAGIFVAIAVLLVTAPICRFMSMLLKNIGARRPLAADNARLTAFVGIMVGIGNPVVLFVKRFYNYFLVKTFITDSSNLELSLGFDVTGMIFGLLIVFFAMVYGYAIKQHAELNPPTRETALSETERNTR